MGDQCLLWATVCSLTMSLHGVRFFWGDSLNSPGSGTLALTMSPSLEQFCTLSSHALICLRRLMSAGLVGGDICSLPCHVDTAQGFVPIPYPFHYVTCLFDFSLDCGMTALLPFPCLSGVESVIMSELKPSGQHSHQAGGEQRGVQSLAQETKSTCFERPPSRLSLSQPLLEGAEV